MKASRILIADDTPSSLSLLAGVLEPLGHEILTVTDGAEAVALAQKAGPDIILLDVMMPCRNGFSACRELKKLPETSEIPVLFITSKDETESVVHGLSLGAVDYITKPFRAEEVAMRVATHLKVGRLTRELQERNAELEAEIALRRRTEEQKETADQRLSTMVTEEAKRWDLGGFVGQSPHLRGILDGIGRLHQFGRTSVLITGENGTGKELVARAIHFQSPRCKGPFVPLNCAAIPADLAESLLFGHVKGAFTGATTDRMGHFELADGGTLFLDEVGDMPLGIQGKLLRVLEDGEIQPVGGSRSRKVDVRLVCATNADLQAKIGNGEFRQDLYFRLARFLVETPPLRERPEDIPLLARHFLKVISVEMGRSVPELSQGAIDDLVGYHFPGNVRELKNIMERAIIFSAGSRIESEHLHLPDVKNVVVAGVVAPQVPVRDLPLNLEAAEHTLIKRALDQTRGNVAKAARLLGVNRSLIYRKFPKLVEE